MKYYIEAFKRFADFNGRIRRKAYWMFFLFNLIFSIIASGVDYATGTAFIGTIYSLVLLIPSLSAAARRLHDTGRSGWWQLLHLIPVLGTIIVLILCAMDSQEGENDYGSNPKENDLQAA